MVPRRHPAATSSALAVLVAMSLAGTAGSSRQPATPTADAEPLARIERIIVNGVARDQATASEVKVIHAQAVVPAAPALSLFADDEVITGVNVSLTLIMLDAAVEQENTVVIGPASQFSIRGKRSVFLTLGKLLADVRGFFDVLTSRATLGARSTEFEVRVTEDDTRLTVLEGVVDMQQPVAPPVVRRLEPGLPSDVGLVRAMFRPAVLGAQPPQPAPAEQWSVVVKGRQPARTRYPITITNRCKQPHLYDVEGPEALSWFHLFSAERIEVAGGQSRSVEIEIQVDASNVKEGTHKGNGIIKCLDCFSEPGCAQNRDSWGIQVTVGAAGALSVQALEEVSIGGPAAAARPIKVTEERLRAVVNWTTDAIVAGQPSYSAKRIVPHFDSLEERTRAFREARLGAIWRRDVESYETLGNVYSDWGKGAKAVEAYTRLVNQPGRRNDAGFLSSLAEAHRMKGQFDVAEDHTRRALEANRDETVTLNTLGNIYLDRAEAENDPQRSQAFLQRANSAYQRAADASRPAAPAVQGVARSNIGDVHLALGSLAQEQRRYDAAQKEYASADDSFRAASTLYPRYAFSRVGWGDALRGQGEVAQAQRNSSGARDAFTKAEAQYRTGLQAHPDLPDAHVGIGDVLLDQGRPQEALASYARAIKARPTEPAGYYRLGVMLQKENPALASRYLHTHLQLRPVTFKNARTARHAAEIIGTLRVSLTVSVPDLKNLQDQAARDAVSRNKLKVGTVSSRPAANVRAGVVIEQRPPAGTAVAVGSTVDFVLAGSPSTGGTRDEPLVVPDVVNRPVAEAVALIEAAGFSVGRIERKRSSRPEGTVTKQSPGARNRVKPGTVVSLEVAEREIRTVSVPDVVGDDRARAIQKIQEKGLRVGEIKEQASCEQQGKVVSQAPPEDARVPGDTTVSLVVAGAGAAAARVPRVTGLPQANAEAAIRESRLTVRKIDRRETDRQSPGTVLDQKPDANTPLSPGCPVDIVIAVPIPLVEVPRFVGLSEAEARRRLPGGAVGLLAELRLGRVTYQDAGDSPHPGADVAVYRRQITTPTVIAQDPAGNSRVRRGTPVDLVVLRPRAAATPVPSVVGMERSRAEAEIRRAGLQVGQVNFESTKAKAGTVVRQSPGAGAQVRPSSAVNIVIAVPYVR